MYIFSGIDNNNAEKYLYLYTKMQCLFIYFSRTIVATDDSDYIIVKIKLLSFF